METWLWSLTLFIFCKNLFWKPLVAYHQSHNKIQAPYDISGWDLMKSTIFTASLPWNSTLIMAEECTVPNLHSAKLLHHCSWIPHVIGEGKATWLALQCLCPLAAQGLLEWPSSGLETSSFNSKKEKSTEPDHGPVLIHSLEQRAFPMRALVICFTTSTWHWEMSEGFSHLCQLQIPS